MASMTIVDFLRAEIDRDEANLRSYIGPWAPEPIQQRRLDDFVAKRRIIDLYTEAAERAAAELVPNDHEVRTAALGDVIQILAEAYDTRPGWQEEWRPIHRPGPCLRARTAAAHGSRWAAATTPHPEPDSSQSASRDGSVTVDSLGACSRSSPAQPSARWPP